MKELEFYCVSCGKKVMIPKDDVYVKVAKNSKRKGGVPMLKGKHQKCGCKVNKFIKKDSVSSMKKKYGSK